LRRRRCSLRRRRCSRRRLSDGFDSFATYFGRVLQRVQEGLSLSQEAVNVMDSFVKDIFERITDEAARLVRSSKRSILTSRDMQTSVRLLLPGKRGKHAISSATKAVIRYLTGK
ncbi:histone H2B type F-M-like, partial [Balaenoptera ricei]|uniref:histone H2B type F-M-like n=1 Tax=Balaenoptera ricei TaxID=2746895 RepID=UPI0028BF3704